LEVIKLKEEELLLFTVDAFHGLNVPPSPGPVYIHAEACTRFSGNGGIPEAYRGRLLTLEAFGTDRKLISEVRATDSREEKIAEEMFANPEVEYVQVRSTEAGCFLFRLERN
jgi:hypothetical protein